ncbi:MAG TPA: phosphate/phosphite/phosphonate ABC transporter substrate-binding protein [Gammaproteobacteria bacterium]|nr:phosphate/phosphite/phosphonate ABC transporter substrate-binding protein [Gammaproteobacteria bacterium]
MPGGRRAWAPLAARRLLCIVLLSALGCLSPARAGEVAQRPLVLGILPFQSPVTLFKRFAPLRDYLSKKLGHAVILETARDFPEFIHRTAERRYDFVITAPHFTLLALESGKYELRARYTKPLRAVVVVRSDSPITDASQLAGRTVSTPPRFAVITLLGQHYLAGLGLTGARAPHYEAYLTHNASHQAMIGGEASAAIISINVYNLARKRSSPLRIVGSSPPIPSMGILAASDLPSSLRIRFGKALVEMSNTESGRALLKRMAYPGFRVATPRDFAPARPYLEDYLHITGHNADKR